jgi:IS5 family transposase
MVTLPRTKISFTITGKCSIKKPLLGRVIKVGELDNSTVMTLFLASQIYTIFSIQNIVIKRYLSQIVYCAGLQPTCERIGKRLLMGIKKFHWKDPEGRKEAIKELKEMTRHVVEQASGVANSLYSRGFKEAGRAINRLVSPGKKIVDQTRQVLSGESPKHRIYSLHEPDVAAIKKGKSHPDCEFGAIVALAKNDDGLILSHVEYQHNVADVKTMGQVITGIKVNMGRPPQEVVGDRGFDQSLKKQENCRRRWGVKRIAVPKKGKKPHPDSGESWFKRAVKQRVKIEPVIGHLKSDHRMNRCRYKGASGDTVNVVWATLAWNTKKVVHLHQQKEEKQTLREMKRAA